MAIPNATESRLWDALNAALADITATPANYLTAPTITESVPLDSLPKMTTPRVYTQFVRMIQAAGDAGTAKHRSTAMFTVWVAADTVRTVMNCKADVLRAIFKAEGTVTQAFGQPFWPMEFAIRDEMTDAGNWIGGLAVNIDVEIDHATP